METVTYLGHFWQHCFRSISRKTVEGISTKLATIIKHVSFAINNTQLKMVFLLSWEQIF